MEARQYALLLELLRAMDAKGSWCGETHLQKATYFLQELYDVLDFDFILYKHGPYSFELHQVLGDMRAKLLIDAKQQPPYGPSLKPGPSAQVLVERSESEVAAYRRAIDFVAERLSRRGVVDLERLATALYVIRNHPEEKDKAQLMHELKPRITKERAAEAIKEVEEIRRERVE